MGLGKTVEMLALILSNPFDDQVAQDRLQYETPQFRRSVTAFRRLSKATLVVVPHALLQQWRDEICKVVAMGKLTVGVWSHSVTRQGMLNPRELTVKVDAAGANGIALKLGAPGDQRAVVIERLTPKARGQHRGQLHLYDCPQVDDLVVQIDGQKIDKLFTLSKIGNVEAPAASAGKDSQREWRERVLSHTRKLLTDAARKGPITLKLARPPLTTDQLASCDIVLTTYEMLKVGLGGYGIERLNGIMWWRVVLDESQKISSDSKSRVFSESIRQITELHRVHSWLVSGTPVSNMVHSMRSNLAHMSIAMCALALPAVPKC